MRKVFHVTVLTVFLSTFTLIKPGENMVPGLCAKFIFVVLNERKSQISFDERKNCILRMSTSRLFELFLRRVKPAT